MSSTGSPDLQRFLADLGQRRARLAAVAGSVDEGLARELVELGESLVVAGEELRVQAEELADLRRRLEETTAERELSSSTVAGLLSTRTGALVSANLAALRLADQTSPRRLPRPVASWFVVEDRPRVRSMITALTRGSLPEVRADLRLRRRDGSAACVEVAVEPVDGGEEPLLRWTLVPPARQNGGLRLVTEPAGRPVDDLLADDLTNLALDLATRGSASAVLAGVVEAAAGLVPDVEDVVLTLLRRGEPELSESTSPAAELSARELAVRRGPGCDVAVMGGGSSVVSPDLAHDPRWAEVAPASLEVDPRSVVAVCVDLPGVHRTAVLSCYGAASVLGEEARRVAVLVAAHASLALDRILTEESLRAAIETRQEIGEAVGILVERDHLTPEEAYDELVSRSQRANRRLREVARLLVEAAVPTGRG